ncbi:MAG: TonB-dependent receptor [Terracidiphilus sp.]|jgi:hypothetical protein
MTYFKPVMLLLCLTMFACGALAQTTGTISGTVKDASGAVVPGVTVSLTNVATAMKRDAATNASGEYAFPSLDPGQYDVEFRGTGFAPMLRHVTLNVTEHIAVDITLVVTANNQEIVVTADAPILQTQDNTLGRVVDGQAIKQLPLATRNFTQILALSPGTNVPLNDATALGRGTTNISSDGSRTGSNAFYIDGIDAVNIHVNSASNNTFASNGVVVPSPEAIQEFKVQTGLYDATAGRSGGGNVALVTRSGTDKFHGSVYEFIRNDDLNANLYFFNTVGTPRPELKQNQFGGTIGGPIIHRRAYFFFSYQGTRQVNGVQGSSTLSLPQIPTTRTDATLGAAFGGLATYKGGTKVNSTGTNINPVALALLNLTLPNGAFVIPSPQTSVTSGVNYAVSVPSTFHEDQYVDAVDYQVSQANHLSFKSIVAQQPQFNSFPDANVPGFGTTQLFAARLYSLTDTHIFSPNLVNEARFGVNRSIGSTGFQNQFPLSGIGMTRSNSAQFSDIPEIVLTGGTTIGYSVNADQAGWGTTYEYFDTLSWIHAKHQVAMGGEARRYQDNYYSNNRMRGTMTIETFQDFLLGLPGSSTASGGNGSGYSNVYSSSFASGAAQRNDILRDYAFFAQDSWRLAHNLTVNYGMRWEYIGLPVDKGGRDGDFYPSEYVAPAAGAYTSSGFVQTSNARKPITGIPFTTDTMTYKVGKLNFGPRVGIAYQFLPRLNIRAGYGLSVDRPSNQLGLLESLSLPNYEKIALSGTGNVASTLADPFPTLPTVDQFPIVPQLYGGPYTNLNPALAINDIDPKWRTPYVQQYGLNLQIQAAADTVVEIGYVGSHGVALPDENLLNQALIASPTNPVNGVTTTTAANAQSRVPYIGFSPSGLIYLQTKASSAYNGLQTSVTQRLNHGLQLLASFTHSKSMDDMSGSTDGTTFGTFYNDQTNLRADWAPSDFDRTNRIVVSGVYTVPAFGFALDRTAVGKRAFNGWQIAGVGTGQSGAPFTVTDTSGGAYYGGTTSTASFATGASVSTAVLSGSTESRLTEYFNTAAYVKAGNYFGNAGRNNLRGPFVRNIDTSIIKQTLLHKSLNFEFRAEFFNVLNFANFANPVSAISSSSFGKITSTVNNPRVIQFAGKINF